MILYHTVMNGPQFQENLRELLNKRLYLDHATFEKHLLFILIGNKSIPTKTTYSLNQTAG